MKTKEVRRLFFSIAIAAFLLMTHNLKVSAADITEDLTATSAVATVATETGYEGTVISRMAGRAGAKGTGAKGIAFEVMYSDIKNKANMLKKGVTTRFAKSSIATQSDLVTVDKRGIITERIQCKDTPSLSGVKDTIEKYRNGQYRGAELVGTSESAKAFNEKAAKTGINKVMKDSGISTETTERIATKSKGKIPKANTMVKTVAKTSAIGAAVTGTLSLAESVQRGDSFEDTVGNVTVGATEGAVSAGVATVVGEAAAVGVAAAGVTGTAAVVALPVGAAIAAGVGTDYVLESANQKYDLEGKIASGVSVVKEKAVSGIKEAERTIDGIKDYAMLSIGAYRIK